ncbi:MULTISPECIES: M23 family metallopeptidase [Okeania]|uniref:M23 family metallopeptidase n=1 Tax=Okeania hirsuta TaxID=1458930 RepID=A0A3N6PPB8_9CYAN|nr:MULTISPECIES: M23 family metallopeptidase [Okeania]NEP03743.1 M23 family metallopeptidase [Okeania sp. SIO4D6]NET16988.1 M23 family metallopeptidase [Okeania sp. SIO1H6]NEP75216.1 M23 family metallopeptidase [Okeania sp. SIO2G5]NEP96297.1 M23 family metallopeptidase [Okeania sp. SIO2F5]NEQ94011.1 M23 family metallopeptidase [Okeania sp. SIO2G4]
MFWSIKIKQFIPSLILAIVTTILVIASPGFSQTVQITPTNPQLGDTLSVVIPESIRGATPTVSMDGKTYPFFSIGQNKLRALLPTTPLDRPGTRQLQINTEAGVQNVNVNLQSRSFPTQSIWLPPGKDSLKGTDLEFDRVGAFKKLVTPEKFWNGPFIRPNQGPVSTIYGVRRYYNGEFAENYYHRGVDYADYNGSPVVAPAAGRVALVGLESQGFEIHGNTVGIDHGQGVTSIFIHLSRINVKEGDFVKAGQLIGAVGSTGASTGPHLHWGLYVSGQAVDPVPWRYEGIE